MSPNWSPKASFINCLGNLFYHYHINTNFIVKEKNSENLLFCAEKKKEVYLIAFYSKK